MRLIDRWEVRSLAVCGRDVLRRDVLAAELCAGDLCVCMYVCVYVGMDLHKYVCVCIRMFEKAREYT